MKEEIRKRARELGFGDCRVTSAQAPQSAERFREWLQRGHHGEMEYLKRNAEKRFELQKVLAGAKSVITLATSYATNSAVKDSSALPVSGDSSAPPNSGLVARYARYDDYHDVLAPALTRLEHFLTELGGEGTRSLWYVDTGPILERDLAQRAGLGFIGKHTNLISRRLGNWIFLSEILTTLELEPDPSEQNHCGSCTRCIAACPTEAIVAPFQLDAQRCISYLTIELKGPIPVHLRPAIGNRIFGCDDCLAVCPWNRFAREGRLMQAHARPELTIPDLLDLLALDDSGFKSRFAGTPLLRSKRRGLLRNVCVALGNVGDRSALPALTKAAADSEPLISEHAHWAIQQIESQSTATPALPGSNKLSP